MHQDQQTYRRATGAALAGLGIQVLLTLVMMALGLQSQTPAVHAAVWHLLGGLPIWIILLVLYYQHKLERAEALEAEQLSRTDVATAALFDERADDLQIARRRLEKIYKWGLSVVSVVVAVYLLGVGGLLLYGNYESLQAGTLTERALGPAANPFVMVWVTTAIAFVAFIVARYEAGMTQVSQWQLLRGGASYLMGNTFVAVLLAVGAISAWLGNREVFAVLSLVIPGIMVLVGVEIALTYLMGLYRPRRPGEVPRPAFDSRVLGLLTTPESIAKAISDTINYQFGFEVSRSWFYQLLSRAITPLVIFGGAVLILLSALVLVGPYEEAVIMQFGRITGDPVGPGLHFKWPWPIGQVEKYPTGRVLHIRIGSSASEFKPGTAILWTNQHTVGKEEYLVSAPTPLERQRTAPAGAAGPGAGADRSAPGMSLVAAELDVQYLVRDLGQFIRSAARPEKLLEDLATRRLNRYFVTKDIDTLIGPGRHVASDELKQQIQADADQAKLGVEILLVAMLSVHPPADSEVAAAFHEQVGALQERQSAIEKAQREAIEMLATVAGSREAAQGIDQAIRKLEQIKHAQGPNTQPADPKAITEQEAVVEQVLASARGRAAELIYDARAYRWQRAVTERAKSERFLAELAAYNQAPELYRMRRYLEVLGESLGNSRKVVLDAQQTQTPVYRMDFKDTSSSLEGLLKPGQ